MKKRRRFKQTKSFRERVSEFVNGERAEADAAPGGADQYELQKKKSGRPRPPLKSKNGRTRPDCSRRSKKAWLALMVCFLALQRGPLAVQQKNRPSCRPAQAQNIWVRYTPRVREGPAEPPPPPKEYPAEKASAARSF